MTAVAVRPRPREVLLRVRLGLPAAQLVLVAVVVAAVRVYVDRPAASAEEGWGFWAVVLAGLLALVLAAWAGWGLLRLTWRSPLRWPTAVAVLAEGVACLVLVPLLVVVPVVFLVELLSVEV